MDKIEKREVVTSLGSDLAEANLVVVARQSGMTVSDTQTLRRKMREAGAHFKVAKNTLVRIAVNGTAHEALIPHLKGPMTLAYSKDHVAAAKILCEFAKNNEKIEVICGVMERQFLDSNAVKQLASLPSIDELRGKLVGLLQAPAGKLARVIQAPPSQLARVLSAYATKG